ncbi:hypothetical protein [Massilia sp. 9096]|uniref:hypothetical protein n=1 Tax=Massilia sp. 9096 TaxID=1500894 RepID=UPI000AAD31C3|nr:hypothetical protein [Massilia sp. 9096]
MPTRPTRKVRLPAALAADRVYRQCECLDSAQQDRRERLDALRAATRHRRH